MQANRFQRGEADALHLARFQQREILFGDADRGGEILDLILRCASIDVEVDDDGY
jgi:hypothetical protein